MGIALAIGSLALGASYLLLVTFLPGKVYFDPVGPRIFPTMIAIGFIACGLVILWEAIRARRTGSADGSPDAGDSDTFGPWPEERHRLLTMLAVSGLILCYALLIEPLGYIIVTLTLSLAVASYLNRGKHAQNILSSVAFTFVVYFGFTYFLRIRLPGGFLATWF